MTYISSPFYGHYDSFISLIKKINLADDDDLFILGNAIGHHEDSMKLLTELSYRPNVYLIMGRQEFYAKTLLPKLQPAASFVESYNDLEGADKELFGQWIKEGGYNFARDFFELPDDEKDAVLDYLEDMEEVSVLEHDGKQFVAAYSAPRGFVPDADVYSYPFGAYAMGGTDYGKKYFKNSYLITACTSTDEIPGGKFGKVYSGPCRHLSLATAEPSQGRPSAIRLEGLKVFYGEEISDFAE